MLAWTMQSSSSPQPSCSAKGSSPCCLQDMRVSVTPQKALRMGVGSSAKTSVAAAREVVTGARCLAAVMARHTTAACSLQQWSAKKGSQCGSRFAAARSKQCCGALLHANQPLLGLAGSDGAGIHNCMTMQQPCLEVCILISVAPSPPLLLPLLLPPMLPLPPMLLPEAKLKATSTEVSKEIHRV